MTVAEREENARGGDSLKNSIKNKNEASHM
jgi:hypothetical protein